MLFSTATAAAIDVKVGGQWQFNYGYASNSSLMKKDETGSHNDKFRARQRIRTQIEFIADENLSAMLNLEANMEWGRKSDSVNGGGGAIDTDEANFVIKQAYLNWIIPNTQVKTRMGLQGIAMPSALGTNAVLSADVAGISISNQFTPEVGLTVFWARAYDASYDETDQPKGKNSFDDVDIFGVALPIKTDVIRFAPWALFASIGKDSEFYTVKTNRNFNRAGSTFSNADFDGTGYGWWFGGAFELPVLDPFFVKIDAMYGKLDTGESDYEQSGWMVSADMGYKFSWGSVSAIGFYSSGNDDDDDYGQLPIISNDTAFNLTGAGGGFYGLAGAALRRWDGYLSDSGQGLWGLGFKIADVSFVDNLKHTLLGMWYGGTNKGDSMNNRRTTGAFKSNTTLMTSDHAWEITLVNEYKVNDNLSFRLDLGYIDLELGNHWENKDETKGNFFSGIGVMYSF